MAGTVEHIRGAMAEQGDVESRVEDLRRHPGPIIVMAKGHSGTRFLAQVLQRSGVFIGADLNPMHDSLGWADQFAIPLITSRWFPDWPALDDDPEFAAFVRERLAATLDSYLGPTPVDGPWGWKGSTLFVTPIVAELFPDLRVIHLIRDGRDVALSEDGLLNLPFYFPVARRDPRALARQVQRSVVDRKRRNDYRLRVFLGRSDLDTWEGIPVRRGPIRDNRYLLQMQSWIRNVTEARRFGADHADRYLELRYEELVTEPVRAAEEVLAWLGLPVGDDVRSFAATHARTSSIGKWKHQELAPDRAADFDRACAHGRALLTELGYE